MAVLAVLQRVQSRGVHAQQPVTNGSRQSGQIQRLVVGLVFQIGKPLADGFVRHRRYPQSAHGTLCPGLLHHPPLDELTLLSRVTAVHDALGLLHQAFDNRELLLDAVVVNQLDAETLGNHR